MGQLRVCQPVLRLHLLGCHRDGCRAPARKHGHGRVELGARAWLAIPEPPTTAWPKIKQFFADNGVAFEFEDPEEGRLNTAWLSLDAQAYRDVVRAAVLDAKQSAGLGQGKDRLLIRVEQGLQPTATEVHLRHDNDQQGSQIGENVAALNAIVSDLNDAESKLLSEIGAYIAARVAESTVSRVAQEIGSGAKTGLVRNAAGQPMLRLFLDRGRAWATLGRRTAARAVRGEPGSCSGAFNLESNAYTTGSAPGVPCAMSLSRRSLISSTSHLTSLSLSQWQQQGEEHSPVTEARRW